MTDSPGTTVQAALSGSFSVERDLAAAPDRVFACYAEPAARRRWFGVPGAPDAVHQLDFRPGGGEVSRGHSAATGTPELVEYRSVFWDIVPGARLVFGYELVLDGIRRWTSLVTVELSAADDGARTRLRHTEHYVYLAYSGDVARRPRPAWLRQPGGPGRMVATTTRR